jgi:hypothetical protein
MTCKCSPIAPADHSYFVVMIDYGRKGLEAIVDPAITRREVISRIRSREYDRINFIHFIDDGRCEDVTNSILQEAGFYELEAVR